MTQLPTPWIDYSREINAELARQQRAAVEFMLRRQRVAARRVLIFLFYTGVFLVGLLLVKAALWI